MSKSKESELIEEWKPYPTKHGIYQISNLARVKNFKGKLTNTHIQDSGLVVEIFGSRKSMKLIVGKLFVDNPNGYKYLNNKDGDKANCIATNLEWSRLNAGLCKTEEAIRNKAIDRYVNSKESSKSIGKEFGVSALTIIRWVSTSGNVIRKQGGNANDESIIDMAVADYQAGMLPRLLGVKYGVAGRTILQWVENRGIKTKTVRERFGITDEIISKARDMYINEKLNCVELSKIFNVSGRTVLDWVKDVSRTQSEIASIQCSKGRTRHHFGKKSIVETRFGIIKADSSYEADRIRQLDKDHSVISVARCPFSIKYNQKHHYNPDFHIEYSDGSIVVEEVKPMDLLNFKSNGAKHEAGKEFCLKNGYTFRIVTEQEIYGKRKPDL
jgi:transposase